MCKPFRQVGIAASTDFALFGISFQLQCYLAEFAPELVRGVNLQKASNHFLEAFSDYTKPDSQRLVCVQVKRTLNNSTLAKAAEEAVVLDEFFETEVTAVT